MKAEDAVSWEDAVNIDRMIRSGLPNERKRQKFFVHYSCTPLEDVDFSTLKDHGQLDLFNNECEGMCGV